MSDIKCPLCDTIIRPDGYIRSTPKSESYFECERCGNYSLHDLVSMHIDLNKTPNLKAILSYWVRKNQKKQPPHLDSKLVDYILENVILPDINDQENNLITYLGKNSSYGKALYVTLNNIIAIVGSIDKESLLFIVDNLNKYDCIEILKPAIGKASLMNRDARMVECRLTFAGWDRYKKMNSKNILEKSFNFKNHKLSEDNKLWLCELFKINFNKVDAKHLKVKLWNKISPQFNPTKIDYKLVRGNRLTLLGLWYIDPKNLLFGTFEKVLGCLKDIINNNPDLDSIDSNSVASSLNISERDVKIIFTFMWDFSFCSGGSQLPGEVIFNSIKFGPESISFDNILAFTNLNETLESFYMENESQEMEFTKPMQPLPIKTNNIFLDKKNIWEGILSEYGISKQRFGRKINFIHDQYQRKIIFRDVEDAYLLCKNGFSKSAVILAGGVIEELLRQYLISKGQKPSNNTFDLYIKTCKNNNLLGKAVNLLSDSVRHFRNIVHLEKEKDSKLSISPSMALSAVASVFTIINDF
jgi:hypothetical protein